MKRGAAAALVALGVAGCRQILDVDGFGTLPSADGGATAATGGIDGYSYVSAACRDCVDEHCEEEASACRLDPSCAARARCLAGCAGNDHECRGVCSVSTPGSPALSALTACEAAHCAQGARERDHCAGALAVRGGIDCNRCLAERCRDVVDATSRSRATLEYIHCDGDCTCQGECAAPGCTCVASPDAVRLASDFAACCPDACRDDEPDWTCIGRIPSLRVPATAPPLELQMQVETVGRQPVPSLHVQACPAIGSGTADCTGTTAMTDSEGWVSLRVPRPRFGDSYFMHLRVTSDAPDYSAPALFYFFPPVVATPLRVTRRMVSRATADYILSLSVPDLVPDWDNDGGIVFSARSCNSSGRGLQLIPEHGERVLYFRTVNANPVVDVNATETQSDDGIGFVANVKPGRHNLVARLPGTDELVGEYSVLVEAGSLTHILFNPTALPGE